MKEITTRKATLDDLEILLSFEQGVITAERPFDGTLKQGDINYYDLRHLLTASHIQVVVAESGGEIVGSGYARIEDSKLYLKHQKHGFLGFMYVKPSYRGKGINQKIIEALKQWCITQGVHEFRLEVYNDNLPAIKAYEKVGFAKLMILMRSGVD